MYFTRGKRKKPKVPLIIKFPMIRYLSYSDCSKLDLDSTLLPYILAAFGYRLDLAFNCNAYWRTNLIAY